MADAAVVESLRLSMLLANELVRQVLCGECVRETDAGGRTWYDVRPLLHPAEQSARSRDLHAALLDYARQMGLTRPHPVHAHLVRYVGPEA
ncbi:MAG TPA: hypothetical protein PLB26_06815 [Rubrivivax sp.]|nr:hypothetical protein [Rubrivivax sp.]